MSTDRFQKIQQRAYEIWEREGTPGRQAGSSLGSSVRRDRPRGGRGPAVGGRPKRPWCDGAVAEAETLTRHLECRLGQPCRRQGLSDLFTSGRSVLLDFFRLLVVDFGNVVARCVGRANEFIQFRLQGLRIAMLGPLNKERHCPGGKRRDAMPVKSLVLEDDPADRESCQDQKSRGPGRENACKSQGFSNSVFDHLNERGEAW